MAVTNFTGGDKIHWQTSRVAIKKCNKRCDPGNSPVPNPVPSFIIYLRKPQWKSMTSYHLMNIDDLGAMAMSSPV